MKYILIALLMVLASLALIAGCSTMPQITTLEGEERDAAVTLAEPLAENIFVAMNEGDYTKFSRDFNENMIKALKEQNFTEMKQTFDDRIGLYQSREVTSVQRIDQVYVITYAADFEKESDVSVTLSVSETDPPQVAGLWFDSPKLREK